MPAIDGGIYRFPAISQRALRFTHPFKRRWWIVALDGSFDGSHERREEP
jgi:hypothetical protein